MVYCVGKPNEWFSVYECGVNCILCWKVELMVHCTGMWSEWYTVGE